MNFDVEAKTILQYAKKIGEFCLDHNCKNCPFWRISINDYGETSESNCCMFNASNPSLWIANIGGKI